MSIVVTLIRFAVLLASITTPATFAFAKLPAPTAEQKASAAETASKNAWSEKVDLYKLCLAQDRVAQSYRSKMKGAAPPPASTPSCVNPGAYVAVTPTESKPSEASGAHSPPGTAISPPSTNTPAAAQGKK